VHDFSENPKEYIPNCLKVIGILYSRVLREAPGRLMPFRNTQFKNSAYLLIFLHFLSAFCPKPGSSLFKCLPLLHVLQINTITLEHMTIDSILASPLPEMLHKFSTLYKDLYSYVRYTLPDTRYSCLHWAPIKW